MAVVLDRLAAETEETRFEVLKGFLLDEQGDLSYGQAAGRLNMSVAAITSAIHRLKGRFRVLLYEEISNTVESPDSVETELRYLLSALGD
jgi:RNA polymerase sigma-70 factor (ECF subfamily)